MNPMLERLEGRRLLAGHGPNIAERLLERAQGVEDAAVQASVALVQADLAAVQTAKQELVEDSSDTRQALKDVLQAGAELLAADRQAIRDARGDAEMVEAAMAKLRADRQQLRHDIAAAREALRTDTEESRSAFREVTTALRDHLRQLKTDLENAGVTFTRSRPPAPPAPPSNEGEALGGEAPVDGGGAVENPVQAPIDKPAGDFGTRPPRTLPITPEHAQTIVDHISAAAQNITGIDQAAVNTLTEHLVAAAVDSEVTPEERHQLRQDARAVFDSLSREDIRDIAQELHELLGVPPGPPRQRPEQPAP